MTIDSLNTLSLIIETFLLCIQIPTLIALIIYVWKTWEMASATKAASELSRDTLEEMRQTRDQESAPYVVTYFDVIVGKNTIYLVIKNIGKSIAKDVQLKFDPPLQGKQNLIDYVERFASSPIQSLPPNYEIKTIFHDTTSYFSKKSNYPF